MKELDRKAIEEHRGQGVGGCTNSSRSSVTRAVIAVPVLATSGESGERSVTRGHLAPSERLSEATGLAKAIGLQVRFAGTVPLTRMRPATLLGTGKVEEIAAIVKAEDASVVIVDYALTPIQQRNLERAWHAKVLDRTGLILEIFAGRARSKEGRLQVELARLTYQKSRLVRSWTHLERQRGGFGFLGGPGETQIEADRRAIGERIDAIKSELAVIERTRRLHRRRRKVTEQQIVSLVGYTNAGKSSLFNVLSGGGVLAKDMFFATLDPTLRRVKFPQGGGFILSDTVGFISQLPTQLVAAFRSTVEEVREADLILHVRDIASDTSEAQRQEVQSILAEIGIDQPEQANRVIEVWNKADLLPEEERTRLSKLAGKNIPPAVLLSAKTGDSVAELVEIIHQRLQAGASTRDVVVGTGNGLLVHWLYENTEVLQRHDQEDGSLRFQVRVPLGRLPDLDRHLHNQP